jgi:hypothetical protein
MQAVAGKLCDAESVVALKDFFSRLNAGNLVAEGVEGTAGVGFPNSDRTVEARLRVTFYSAHAALQD